MCNGCGKHRHWQQVCRASSVKFVSDGDQNLNSNPQSTYVITHVVCQDSLKGIFFDLDLSPPASTPASPKRLRLTLVTPATLYMSLTSTSSPLYEWICPLSVSPWLLKVSHPNLGAKHITVHLAWEIIQDYCPINHCGALLCPPLRIGWQHPHEGIIHYDVDTANHLESTQTSSPSLGELTLDYIKLANPELFECSGKLSEPFSITLNPDVKPIQAPPHRYAAP